MKQLLEFITNLFQEKLDYYDRHQCEHKSSSAGEFNCCVKRLGHRGLHMSADGNTWFNSFN